MVQQVYWFDLDLQLEEFHEKLVFAILFWQFLAFQAPDIAKVENVELISLVNLSIKLIGVMALPMSTLPTVFWKVWTLYIYKLQP